MTFSELGIKEVAGKTRYSTQCPQCNESRLKHKNVPCLTVNNERDNRWWHCNHCGWSGNLDISDKFKQVHEKSRIPKQIAETYSKEVRDYLEGRGIEPRTAIKERVYEFTMASKPIIGFPFYMGQTLVNVKYFNVRWKEGDEGPKWWQMPKDLGTKSIFLGMQSLTFDQDEKKEVIVTEGEWDWLTWKQCGHKNVLSVPMGAPNPKAENFEHEFDYANDKYVMSVLQDAELIIFSTDNDDPGRKLRDQLALIFGRERCKYINYPTGYKDINEVFAGHKKKGLKAQGKAGVDECYQNLSSFPINGVIRPTDVKDELELIASNGFVPGYGIGVERIDDLFTLKRKMFTVLTGLPGSGKSVWVRWYLAEFICHNEKNEFIKWAMFTPENRPVSREQAKLAEAITGQSYRRGYKNSMSEDVRSRTLRYIQQHFFFISPNKMNYETWGNKINQERVNTMDSLMQYLIYLKKTENIFGFVIDAWNKIEHEQPKGVTDTNFISQQLDHLINFIDVWDLHCILIAHPTKIEKVGINYRMPMLYDIKGSSAWKEKPDIGIILHRYINKRRRAGELPDDADEDDKYYMDNNAPTIVKIEKIRFEELGHPGRVKMRMDYAKGGRFFLMEDTAPKPDIPPLTGKLNPAEKDEPDEVFNGDKDETKGLPF